MDNNEVKIKVTSEDATEGGFRSAEAKGKSFGDRLKGILTKAGKEGAEALTGPLQTQIRQWNVRVRESEGVVESLRKKIAETGDTKLFGDLSKAEANLKKLGSFRDSLVQQAKKAGEEGAEGFSLSFVHRVGPLVARAPIGPGLLAAVATAVPIVAPAISSMIAVGAAGGAVALGAALSAQNPRVAGALESLSAHIGSELRLSAAPFTPAMLDSIQDVKDGVRTLRPELDQVFAKASTYLDPLIQGGMGFIQNMLPGFRKLVDAAEPLIDVLGEELPELGEDFAGIMTDVAEAARESEDEFRAILDTVGLIVSTSGGMLPILSEANGLLEIWNAKQKEGHGLIKDAQWVDPIKEATEAFEDQTEVMKDARDIASEYADTLDRIKDQNLSAAEASLAYREELDDAKKAMDGKRKVTREEEGALLDLAKSSNDLTSALDDQGRSAGQAANHHKQLRRDFINAAMAAGHTREEAARLADQYLKIPRNVRTNVQAETDAARREVAAYRRQLDSIRRTITTSFNVDINGNATVFRGQAHGGIVGSAASGGIRSNLIEVGEHGREIIDLPPGAHVSSNPDTERALAGGTGGGSMVVEVQPRPGADTPLMNKIIEGLLFTIRTDSATASAVRGV